MKKLSGSTLKILAASSMVVFSLFACVIGAIAWFTSVSNKEVSNDEFIVETKSGRFKQVTFHTLDKKTIGNSYAQSTFNFSKDYVGKISYDWVNKTMSKEGNTDIVFDNYDYLEHEQPILLLFEFDQEYTAADKITISATARDDNAFFLGERNSEGDSVWSLDDSDVIVDTINGENYYAMSSAICFYSRGYSASTYISTFGEKYDEEPTSDLETTVASALSIDTPVWNESQNQWKVTFSDNRSAANAVNYYGNLAGGISGFELVASPNYVENGYQAVYSSSTGYVKVYAESVSNNSSTVTVSVGLGTPFYSFTNLTNQKSFVDLSQQPESSFNKTVDSIFESNSATKYAAVIVDYYSDAIEYIYSSYLGDAVLQSYDSILHFICDWTMEVI